jgi:S1-C subfamily serine protease
MARQATSQSGATLEPVGSLARLLTGCAAAAGLVLATANPTISARLDIDPITAARAAQLIDASTVQLDALACNLTERQGSAVAVDRSRLLTAAHVVAGSRTVDIVADGFPTTTAQAAGVAPAGDVAIVPDTGVTVPPLALAPADALPGSRVWLGGYPSVPAGQPAPGLEVDGLRVVDYVGGAPVGEPWPVMRLSGSAAPGMSGGPVLDATGRLVGMVVGNEVPGGDALVVPVDDLSALLTANSFTPAGC